MVLWWLQVVLPLMIGAALLAWCGTQLLLRLYEQFPSFSLAGLKMSILESYTDVNKLKSRLAELANTGASAKDLDKKALEKAINNRIFGQSHIIREIVDNIYNESLREKRDGPVGKYMIAGPSGTGKSMLAKVLGEEHFGKNGYVVFDMATANSVSNANSVFGSPMGYQGGHQSSPSVAHLINYPASVVLVDEFEKTERQVQHRFLESLQDGLLTNVVTGNKVDVSNAIFVFTTNAMQEQCAKAGANQQASLEDISAECKRILASTFDSAIMSRIDMVFAFQPLNDVALCELVASKIIRLIESYPMQLEAVDFEVLAQWVQRYRLKSVDGRDIATDVKRTISQRLNELKRQGVQRVKIIDKKNQIAIEKA